MFIGILSLGIAATLAVSVLIWIQYKSEKVLFLDGLFKEELTREDNPYLYYLSLGMLSFLLVFILYFFISELINLSV